MKVPKIRLTGFSSEWKIAHLKHYAKKSTEKNSANLYTETFTNSAEHGVISQRDFFDHDISNLSNISGYYIIHPENFVYNPRVSVTAPVGPINKNNLNRSGVMSPLYLIFSVDGVDKEYLAYFFKTKLWHRYMLINGNCGARFDRLSIPDDLFMDMPISLPSDSKEQRQIAEYFKYLDSMIEATTKKTESLKQTKLACLQSMFPQNGETKPRVRFKEFKDDWDILPLSTFARKSTEKNISVEYKITLTNSAEYGVVNQLDFFDHDISNDTHIDRYYVIHNDDFVYNPRVSTFAPVGPINRNTLGYSGVMSPLYLIFKVTNINKDYLSYFFKTTLWHQYMKLEGNTGARFDRLALSDTQFFNMPIYVPKQKKEQEAIASFFSNLDKQITLHEQRLEKLKTIKKACLDSMFV